LSGMLCTLGRVLTVRCSAARYCRRQAVGALKEKIRKFESSEKNQK
jgi:hypothetical protein